MRKVIEAFRPQSGATGKAFLRKSRDRDLSIFPQGRGPGRHLFRSFQKLQVEQNLHDVVERACRGAEILLDVEESTDRRPGVVAEAGRGEDSTASVASLC
ncbi:hypothetical protein Pve01_19810 [Planomonospora venezuelensis]|nr:hypothetical protein Pve01_19810 [Planomonospora venezuelensis]